MFTKYVFENNQKTPNNSEVFCICNICKTLFSSDLLQNNDNCCTACLKKKSSSFYLYSIKSIICDNIDQTREKKSWSFFTIVEKNLLDFTCNVMHVDYCKNNLFWYINKNSEFLEKTVELIQKIEQKIKSMYCFPDFIPSKKETIANNLSQEKLFINESFYNSNSDINPLPISNWAINRKMLQKKLDTNLAFFIFD